jgi:hypothetical protein
MGEVPLGLGTQGDEQGVVDVKELEVRGVENGHTRAAA